jgi:hypothetical protein
VNLTPLLCALCLFPAAALAAPGAHLNQGELLAVDFELRSPAHLDRSFYFNGDNHTLAATHELERYIDPAYCAASDPVQPMAGGGFSITVRIPTAAERAACHLKASEAFVSGLVTTQHVFSATYGYWEVRASLPAAMRTWPAIWLLPTEKTAANGGAVPEIDILEEYAGVRHGVYNLRPFTLDRTARPINTVHPKGGKPLSCGITSAYAQPGAWHTYGLLWEPTKLTFYLDDVETCEQDISVTDPHYLIINMAMAAGDYTPGPTSPAQYPTTMYVAWARHRPLRAQ